MINTENIPQKMKENRSDCTVDTGDSPKSKKQK